jgi:uncharacterized membrane protein YgdD (TMEM256/DUF423 family)
MNKRSVVAILGALAVGIGAFGAHGLKPLLDAKTIHAFETGVSYHFFHLAALLFCVVKLEQGYSKNINRAYQFFIAGIICFSGSLYGISLGKAFGINLSFLGPITPVGGVLLMTGWVLLAIRDSK